jgi:hypothetical protein
MNKLRRNDRSIIYENQEDTANMIIETFLNREIVNIMVIAKTQSGTMCATIKNFTSIVITDIMI